MEAICRLAERLNIENVMAVSNEQHIFRSPRYHDKNKVILSDYNAFWASVGGECDSRGYYHIPRTLARKARRRLPVRSGLNIAAAINYWTLSTNSCR